MINDIYIGNPDEQKKVIGNLTRDFKTPRGIFVIGGGQRTGKNTVETKALQQLRISTTDFIRPDINVYDDYPGMYLRRWQEGYKAGHNMFAIGEIPVDFSDSLTWISQFYGQGLSEHRDLKIMFNAVSRKHPAWRNPDIEQDIHSGLGRFFSRDLHTYILHVDKERTIKELWRQRERGQLDLSAKVLGFKTYTDQWYGLDGMKSFSDFHTQLLQLMGEGDRGHPEKRL